MEHLHRGFDRLDIPSVALHGERTERADEPRERGFFKKLGFCHEVQMIVERQTQPDEHGVNVACVVGTKQCAAFRQMLKPLYVYTVEQEQDLSDQPDNRKENHLHCSFS